MLSFFPEGLGHSVVYFGCHRFSWFGSVIAKVLVPPLEAGPPKSSDDEQGVLTKATDTTSHITSTSTVNVKARIRFRSPNEC